MKKKQKCYHCAHAGKVFRLTYAPHCHCEHPRENVRGDDDGWSALRFAFDTCPEFMPKKDNKT